MASMQEADAGEEGGGQFVFPLTTAPNLHHITTTMPENLTLEAQVTLSKVPCFTRAP